MSKQREFSTTHSRLSRSFETLVKWLKIKRQDNSLTMRDVGESLKGPHTLVGKIENCDRNLSVVEYIIYCDAIGADPIEGIRLILEQVRGEFNQQRAVPLRGK